MRTPCKEAARTQRSGEHLAYTNTLRVVLDSKGRVNIDADTISICSGLVSKRPDCFGRLSNKQ